MTKYNLAPIAALQLVGFICAITHADESNDEKKTKVTAKSHAELARLVATALDTENYDTIAELMIPIEIVKKMGAPEETLVEYAAYLAKIRDTTKEYREYLKQEGHLPLRDARFQKLDAGEARNMNGLSVIESNGIFLEDESGAYFQLVNIAFSIDGVWYIVHLRTSD